MECFGSDKTGIEKEKGKKGKKKSGGGAGSVWDRKWAEW